MAQMRTIPTVSRNLLFFVVFVIAVAFTEMAEIVKSSRLRRLLVLLLLAQTCGTLVLVTFARHMGVDEGVWNYMGRMWAHGQTVYRSTMDNKPPGIFAVYTLCYAMAGPGVVLPRLLGVLSMTAAAGGVYVLGRRMHGMLAGVLAALMFNLAMGWEVLDGPNAGQTESFMVLPAIFAFVALWRATDVGAPSHAPPALMPLPLGIRLPPKDRRAKSEGRRARRWKVSCRFALRSSLFAPRHSSTRRRGAWILLAGALVGVALSFKQTAVFTALAWLVMYASLRNGRGASANGSSARFVGEVATFAAGVFAGMAAFVTPVLWGGARFEDYWFGTWVLPLLAGTGNPSVHSRLEKTYHIWCQTSMVLFYLPLAAFVWRSRKLRASGLPVIAIAIWAGLEFIAAGSSGFWYGHQIKQTSCRCFR